MQLVMDKEHKMMSSSSENLISNNITVVQLYQNNQEIQIKLQNRNSDLKIDSFPQCTQKIQT